MHRNFNLAFGTLLVLYIVLSFFMDFGSKDLPFIFAGIVLLGVSVLIRQRNLKNNR